MMEYQPPSPRISVPTRAILYLMAIGRFGFGDHVSDPEAFVLRARKLQRETWPLDMREDRL